MALPASAPVASNPSIQQAARTFLALSPRGTTSSGRLNGGQDDCNNGISRAKGRVSGKNPRSPVASPGRTRVFPTFSPASPQPRECLETTAVVRVLGMLCPARRQFRTPRGPLRQPYNRQGRRSRVMGQFGRGLVRFSAAPCHRRTGADRKHGPDPPGHRSTARQRIKLTTTRLCHHLHSASRLV
jgi:hypothetical protein